VGRIEGHLNGLRGEDVVTRDNVVKIGILLPVRLEARLRGSH
jgi:hypothetical protein